MKVCERHRGNERPALLKFGFGFAGKSYHYVCANRSVGRRGADFLHAIGIMPRPVLAMHASQGRVTSGLQRNMSMAGDTRMRCNQLDEFVAPIHWLNRADAELFQLCLRNDSAHHVGESCVRTMRGKIPPPAAKIDS